MRLLDFPKVFSPFQNHLLTRSTASVDILRMGHIFYGTLRPQVYSGIHRSSYFFVPNFGHRNIS